MDFNGRVCCPALRGAASSGHRGRPLPQYFARISLNVASENLHCWYWKIFFFVPSSFFFCVVRTLYSLFGFFFFFFCFLWFMVDRCVGVAQPSGDASVHVCACFAVAFVTEAKNWGWGWAPAPKRSNPNWTELSRADEAALFAIGIQSHFWFGNFVSEIAAVSHSLSFFAQLLEEMLPAFFFFFWNVAGNGSQLAKRGPAFCMMRVFQFYFLFQFSSASFFFFGVAGLTSCAGNSGFRCSFLCKL